MCKRGDGKGGKGEKEEEEKKKKGKRKEGLSFLMTRMADGQRSSGTTWYAAQVHRTGGEKKVDSAAVE